ncbi:uncharacterized protein LOC132734378 isoform X2 [Ruditapes philippinarum]|uniref:uncharacterized protein LOC132734378 isoform X2 n=1 Tax=Ruditapes philippinarum TaxID=129788 RepID=UPI00295A9B5B|nr:uncharacterized protein LOC132734378 isoform X2 [Ruditapes philippinarum]
MLNLTRFSCYFCIIAVVKSVLIEVKQQNVTINPLERETPDSDCNADTCLTLGKKCENDGECVTDPSTCKSKCACAKGYYGGRCQYESEKRNTSEEIENRDLRGVTFKTTLTECSGQVCMHGECVPAPFGTTRCHCNDGWFGENCGTFGSVIDDDFLKSLTESFHEKLSKVENKKRLHTEEGDRHPKNISGFVINKMDVFKTLKNNSVLSLARKEKNTGVDIQQAGKPLHTKHVEITESLEKSENDTIIENSLNAKYNVCDEDYIERSKEERTCEHVKGIECVYGVCNETLIDYGTWTGYNTTCSCDYGARGLFCENKCCLHCGENGKCDLRPDGDNLTEHCNCRRRYTGFFCEIFLPDPVNEKEWDAFVSYKSHPTDENFVVRVLYPKLEKELGFKLCLHFRDFVPGETISNNIINAVEGSRRTIMVLTPRYVESEFTRFEYQKAQTEMLKRKHRIIPIMLEDISEVSDIDKNLKGIIGSVTYLEWPSTEDTSNSSKKLDKFWKRLQLSLPKKKVTDCEKSALSCSSPPIVSSLSPSGKHASVSSDRDSGFKGSVTSDRSRGSTASESIENWWVSDSTYAQINDVFRDDISESVQPLTEEEEFELIAKGSKQNDNSDKLTYDYVDMEHDRYIEFKPEDNPPSARLTRKIKQETTNDFGVEENMQTGIVKKELPENYIEFELEENVRPASILKKDLPGNYIEFELEENSGPESIVMKDLPENYIEFKIKDASPNASVIKKELPENYIEFNLEDSSPSSSFGADELPENYIEFKAEDNPPSPSLLRKKYPTVQLDIEDYIEVDV